MDGMDIGSFEQNWPSNTISIGNEALGDIEIKTGANDTLSPAAMGMVINLASPTGADQFHGSLVYLVGPQRGMRTTHPAGPPHPPRRNSQISRWAVPSNAIAHGSSSQGAISTAMRASARPVHSLGIYRPLFPASSPSPITLVDSSSRGTLLRSSTNATADFSCPARQPRARRQLSVVRRKLRDQPIWPRRLWSALLS